MKKLTGLFLTATALLLTTIANSQSPNPLYKHLPPSADHIYSIRLGQIIAKGELAGLLGSIPQGKDPNSALALNIIKDPASAGIDLDHEILVAQTTADGTGADTVSYTQILVPLTDSAKWRATYTSATKNQHLHRLPGKGVSTTIGKDGIAWNDHLLVITTASAESPVATVPDDRPRDPSVIGRIVTRKESRRPRRIPYKLLAHRPTIYCRILHRRRCSRLEHTKWISRR